MYAPRAGRRHLLEISSLLMLMVACSAYADASELRLVVKLRAASASGDAIAAQASAIGGVAVRYESAVSPEWHALRLICTDPGACDAATQRLRADSAVYEAVQRDERKIVVAP